MVTIISNELLKDLNDGKVINIEVGPLGLSLASEKWANRMEQTGNLRRVNNGSGAVNMDNNYGNEFNHKLGEAWNT